MRLVAEVAPGHAADIAAKLGLGTAGVAVVAFLAWLWYQYSEAKKEREQAENAAAWSESQRKKNADSG